MSEGVREYWDRRSREADDPLLRGTVTDELPVVRLKDRLEKAHVARVVSLSKDMRALELGAGAGRFGLWLAERVGEVTLVDAVGAQLEVAREHATARGLSNVKTTVSSAEDYVPEAGAYDLVLISGLLCHLEDDALDALVDRVADALAPGGRLVLKEPITSDGIAREDRRGGYLARFRPREQIAEAFERRLPLLYERPTLSHPSRSSSAGRTRRRPRWGAARPARSSISSRRSGSGSIRRCSRSRSGCAPRRGSRACSRRCPSCRTSTCSARRSRAAPRGLRRCRWW